MTAALMPDLHPLPRPSPPAVVHSTAQDGIAGFHGLAHSAPEPLSPTHPDPGTGTLARAHDEVALFQTKSHRAPPPSSRERKLFGAGTLRQVDPACVPAAGHAPPPTRPDMALFDTSRVDLFERKNGSLKPADQLRHSLRTRASQHNNKKTPRAVASL